MPTGSPAMQRQLSVLVCLSKPDPTETDEYWRSKETPVDTEAWPSVTEVLGQAVSGVQATWASVTEAVQTKASDAVEHAKAKADEYTTVTKRVSEAFGPAKRIKVHQPRELLFDRYDNLVEDEEGNQERDLDEDSADYQEEDQEEDLENDGSEGDLNFEDHLLDNAFPNVDQRDVEDDRGDHNIEQDEEDDKSLVTETFDDDELNVEPGDFDDDGDNEDEEETQNERDDDSEAPPTAATTRPEPPAQPQPSRVNGHGHGENSHGHLHR